jgi:glycosyltransferase involved in cell wall biosynthesis
VTVLLQFDDTQDLSQNQNCHRFAVSLTQRIATLLITFQAMRIAMLHLCLVSETFPPEVNGVALTVQSLANHWRALGQRVSVIRPQQGEEQAPERTTLLEVVVPSRQLPKYKDLRFGYPSYARVKAHFQQSKPDVVYIATEGPLGWSALIAARRLNIRVISGFHTRFDQYMGHYGLRWLKGVAFRYLRAFHRRSSMTIVPTLELRDELRAKGFNNVAHHPRGVDSERFSPVHRNQQLRSSWGADETDPVVICVTRLAPEKNLPLLIDSFRKCLNSHPNAKLVLVGDGPMREQLRASFPALVCTGILLGDELAKAYASADIFAFPSLSETFGNVTLEAMASALAIVAFDYGAVRAHVTHGLHGSTVDRFEERAFANALDFEISRWQLGARVGIDARKAAMRLNPRRMAQQLLESITTQPPIAALASC